MNRKEKIDFINENVLPQIAGIDWCGINVHEIIRLISKWRIGKPADIEMTAVVDDGVLSINGDVLGRIAPKKPCVPWSEELEYYEGRCIADF